MLLVTIIFGVCYGCIYRKIRCPHRFEGHLDTWTDYFRHQNTTQGNENNYVYYENDAQNFINFQIPEQFNSGINQNFGKREQKHNDQYYSYHEVRL